MNVSFSPRTESAPRPEKESITFYKCPYRWPGARRAAAELACVVAARSRRRPSLPSVELTVLQHPLPPTDGSTGASTRRPLADLSPVSHRAAKQSRSHPRARSERRCGAGARRGAQLGALAGATRRGSGEGRGGAARGASVYTARYEPGAQRSFCLFSFFHRANIISGFSFSEQKRNSCRRFGKSEVVVK